MTKRWLMSLILGCLLLSLPAYAQTFEDGYQSYMRNQFPVAELQFKSALRKATADEDKAILLKFIGICQYMRGDKKNSQSSFIQALNADRSIAIEAEDVLDPGVITYFNAIKSHIGPELKKKKAQPPVAKATPAPAASPPRPKARKKPAKSKGSESIMGLNDNDVVEDKTRKVSVMQLLPFGFPQFYNDSYWLGSGVAALQVYSLYSILDANKTIKEREGLNQVVATKEGLTDEQRQAFFRENNSFVNKVKSQKDLAIISFSALWIASITESILMHRPPAKNLADPGPPAQSLSPLVQADSKGGTFGLLWQRQLK